MARQDVQGSFLSCSQSFPLAVQQCRAIMCSEMETGGDKKVLFFAIIIDKARPHVSKY